MLSACFVVALLASDPTPSAYEADPKGWTDLLARAGPSLSGWTRLPIPAKGKLAGDSQWTLDPGAGVLTCAGDKGHEWLRYDRVLENAILHVEWRFIPVVSGKTGYNSGLYIRNSADASTWIQAQLGKSGGFLFGETPVDGAPKRFNLSAQVKGRALVKEPGEWNTFEVSARGKAVSIWANGEVACTWDDCTVAKGYVGLEAEGYKIEFRRVLLKES